MKRNKKMMVSAFWVILGIALFGFGLAGVLDEYWSGMGGAMIAVGLAQVIKYERLRRNEAYREKMEVELTDERNHFIRNKAWAWAGYLFVLIMAVSSIVLRLMGQELLSVAAGYAVCLVLVLYWGSYWVLNRKY